MMMIERHMILVGVGGGLGSIVRFLSQKYISAWYPHPFPLATFVVNLFGCFLIGVFYALAEKGNLLTPEWRLFLTTGICGGFTTFSSFAYENVSLLRSGDFIYVALYVACSVVLGIAATFGGIALIKII
jgi:fluoride exporter